MQGLGQKGEARTQNKAKVGLVVKEGIRQAVWM